MDILFQYVKRFKEANDDYIFEELRLFLEEKSTQRLTEQYRGKFFVLQIG
ncbi:hypothetical protein [Lysinibacillus sphaericus]|nr:hypothetical protein [Lysinibacillus sp. SDF0037]